MQTLISTNIQIPSGETPAPEPNQVIAAILSNRICASVAQGEPFPVLQSQMVLGATDGPKIATPVYGQILHSQRKHFEFDTGITESEIVRL